MYHPIRPLLQPTSLELLILLRPSNRNNVYVRTMQYTLCSYQALTMLLEYFLCCACAQFLKLKHPVAEAVGHSISLCSWKMVFSWDRKPAKRKYISVQNKSIRVKYERILPTSSREQDPVAIDETSGSLPKAISASGSISLNSELVDKQSEEAVFLSDALDETKVSYREKKRKRLENWAALADELVEVGTAVLFTPPHSQCICCTQSPDQIFRCMDCGTSAVYCRECLDICHSLPHLHVFEVFKNGTFVCVDTDTPVWRRPDNHVCQTIYCQQIVVMDEHGRQHKRIIELCGCESAAVTMIRSYLWPSSPKNPILGFHIGLLEWMTALLLECHVSTKGFCEALKDKLSKHHKGLFDSEVMHSVLVFFIIIPFLCLYSFLKTVVKYLYM